MSKLKLLVEKQLLARSELDIFKYEVQYEKIELELASLEEKLLKA